MNASVGSTDRIVRIVAGVPIKSGDVTIGVSGAPAGEKDEACANASIAQVADHLK